MNKGMFLERLRVSLSGKVSAGIVEENVAYYEDYINTQVRMGNTEEAVLNSLGDPRLLAKTIVMTSGSGACEDADYREVGEDGKVYERKLNERGKGFLRLSNLPAWAWKVIGIATVVVVASLVVSVVSFLLPFVLPCLLVWFVYKLFRDWLS